MKSDFSNPIFHNETKAREWLEARIWPNGAICPHCGVVGESTLMKGKTTRAGLHQCNACHKPFTVTVGTLYERSKIPLHKWLAATHLIMASKKGISALQVGRMLAISKKSSWFLCHRIRESLRDNGDAPLGGDSKTVEVDASYIGGKEKNKHANKRMPGSQGGANKEAVVSLVERGGNVRSFHMSAVTAKTLAPILDSHIHKKTYIMTDESRAYPKMVGFLGHDKVNHSIGEYVRGNIHSNTVENYFSIMKRGITGVYHHVSQQHLKRYLAEYDYRYNEREALGITDAMRMEKSIQGIVGKRLTYRRSDKKAA